MRRLALLVLFGVLAAGCSGGGEQATTGRTETATGPVTTGASPVGPQRLRLERVVAGLQAPDYVTAAPGEPDTLYVVEQGGRIVVVRNGKVEPRPFLDVSRQIVSGGEQGLLGLAFHPDYASNRKFYVDFTNLEGDTRVVEYRANASRTAADPASARVVLAVHQPYPNHNGGQLAFGPDGRLWVGMGDGGSAGDPQNRAQNLSDRLGKLLRIDVDTPTPRIAIAAYGLRNPWRFSFDAGNGDLWIGDVGQSDWEEIDHLAADRVGTLVNFGWSVYEGRAHYKDEPLNTAGPLVQPVVVYPHSEGCSVTGGYVYRGRPLADAVGRYFYGDFCSGRVWSLRLRNGKAQVRLEPFRVPSLSSFGVDGRGRLYLVSLEGSVYRLAAG